MSFHLHIVSDEKFINGFHENLEKHHPGKSIYLVDSPVPVHELKRINGNLERIRTLNLKRSRLIKKFKRIVPEKIVSVFVHYLTPEKAYLANYLKSTFNIQTNWIYYGGDLYRYLQRKGMIQLYDNVRFSDQFNLHWWRSLLFLGRFGKNMDGEYTRFIRDLDNYCFWNYLEYSLVLNSFETNATWRPFRYFTSNWNIDSELTANMNSIALVGNSASQTNNHIFVLSEIKKREQSLDLDEIIIPLSYGSRKVKQNVKRFVHSHILTNCTLLERFVPLNQYNEILDSVSVAFFGSKRQEGGNNIYYLLSKGVKVYLRKENVLYKHLKSYGYFIYNMEDDFKVQVEDLVRLKLEQKLKNRELVLKEFGERVKKEMYENLYSL